jgi:hypothetical protein
MVGGEPLQAADNELCWICDLSLWPGARVPYAAGGGGGEALPRFPCASCVRAIRGKMSTKVNDRSRRKKKVNDRSKQND